MQDPKIMTKPKVENSHNLKLYTKIRCKIPHVEHHSWQFLKPQPASLVNETYESSASKYQE